MSPTHAIVVGAQKTATTSLFASLRQHPEIAASVHKETHFFAFERLWSGGPEAYDRFFPPVDDRIRLDVSPDYLAVPGVPDRIAELVGTDVRIVAILREPVERAWSQHAMEVYSGFERRGFRDAIDADPSADPEVPFSHRCHYVARSRYAERLGRFLDVFGHDRVRVDVYEEDVVGRTDPWLVELCGFLDVSPDVDLPTMPRSNSAYVPRSLVAARVLRHLLIEHSVPRRIARKLVPDRGRRVLRARLVAANRSSRPVPALSSHDRRELFERYFAADVAATERLIGRSLDVWRERALGPA